MVQKTDHVPDVRKEVTAVEWLVEKLRMIDKNAYAEIYDDIKAAKQMEKEQIIDAYEQGSSDEIVAYNGTRDFKHGVNYYNETYGGQGSPDTSPNTQNK